nr:PREDICTED: DExH-box ATP-dependent RNA helicase DExH6-like isoform X2 [Daucus carota subsp. sativus]
MTNNPIGGATSEAAAENVEGDVVVLGANGDEEEMTDVVLNSNRSGEEVEVQLIGKSGGEEEIEPKATEVVINREVVGGVINRKMEDEEKEKCGVGSNGMRSEVEEKVEVQVIGKSGGEEEIDPKAKTKEKEEKCEAGLNGVSSEEKLGDKKGEVEGSDIRGLVEGQGGGGGAKVTKAEKRKRRRMARLAEELTNVKKRRISGNYERGINGEVNDKMDVDAVEDMDLGSIKVSARQRLVRRSLRIASQIKLGGKIDYTQPDGNEGDSTNVEKQVGEASGKDDLQEDREKEIKGELKNSKQPKQINKGGKKCRPAMQRRQERLAKQQAARDSRAKLISVLRRFDASDDQEYRFDVSLTRAERSEVHLLCSKMGLASRSSGSGRGRRITVYKRRVRAKKIRENNITRFTLSEEAKDVSLNLFTRYPPYDCGSGDKMVGKFVEKTSRRQGPDPFFSRPLMSKFDIKRKVELLTNKLESDPKLKKITEKRTKLPIASFRDAITSAIDSHQVVLISGETGCGKTTQVPQYVLDHVWSKSKTCKIVCTQPRRISAVSVAGRIASERGESIGNSVGYKIKMESEGGRNSSIIFCTTGVLLRLLVNMGSNNLGKESSKTRDAITGPDGITHIIVDEVHERDHFSDLLLAIVRDLLPSKPNIRLVLMSATIDAERFSQYFGGCPVIRVPGFTYPVKTFYLEDILSILKSNENNHLESASRLVTSENILLSEEYRAVIDDTITLAWSNDEYEPLLDLVTAEVGFNILDFQHSTTGVTPLMVFAKKGRVGELCMTLSLGADYSLQDNDGATALEWAERENQKEAAEILKKHMEKQVANTEQKECLLDQYLANVNSELVDFVLIEKLLKKICTDSTDGAILVFLTGWDDIQRTIERLKRNSFFSDASKFLLLALHSKVPSIEQKKVFERPPPGCRKIVLSTNIAESSITIDDVVYVINSGRMKEKSYDPSINVSTLLSSWISKASAKQRAGRAGRCQPGICYHLYSKIKEASFLDFQVPEVRRMPLEELCLQIKILDPARKIGEFLEKLLDPPATQSVTNAISILEELGALSPDEELTELGNKLGSFPVHPVLTKMLLFAILLNCLDPALTLACVSSYRDPFNQPMDPIEKKKAISAKLELASLYGGHGDQLAVIAAFECWKIAQEKGQGASFCSRYYLSPGIMKMVSRMRKKFLSELYRKRFIPKDGPCCSLNAHDPGIRNAVLLAGFYPMVGKLPLNKRGQKGIVETAGGVKVRLTSSSSNYMLASDGSEPLIIFDEIIRGDAGLLVKNCSVIGPLPLLLLAKEIMVAPCEEDDKNKGGTAPEFSGKDTEDDNEVHKHKDSPVGQTIMSSPSNIVKVVVDRWLTFESTALDVAQICCLRERFSSATLFKIRNSFGTQSKIADDSIQSVARILSYDGLSGIPSTLKYKNQQTSETSAPEAEQSELVREKGTSSQDFCLTSLMQQYHSQNCMRHQGDEEPHHGVKESKSAKPHHGSKTSKSRKLHHGGKASGSMKRDKSDQPGYCHKQLPPSELTIPKCI